MHGVLPEAQKAKQLGCAGGGYHIFGIALAQRKRAQRDVIEHLNQHPAQPKREHEAITSDRPFEILAVVEAVSSHVFAAAFVQHFAHIVQPIRHGVASILQRNEAI